MSNDIALNGCRPEPLASYLKSVGLIRIVAAQADPEVRGWFDGCFHLATSLTAEQLVGFLVDDYQPTPILNPWNNGSGFGEKDAKSSKTAFAALAAIESSHTPRLDDYRATLRSIRSLQQRPGWDDLAKEEQIVWLRNSVPDRAVDWIDSAVVLTADSRRFPPLLGTGGNDGRLDFSSTFMQRIGQLFGIGDKPPKSDDVAALAGDALFGTHTGTLHRDSLGQFDPVGAGGPRSDAGGSLSNPWDAVLMFEGAVAFSSSVARRLGGRDAATAVPFTVYASSAGYASAAAESSRGEFWAPVWRQPARYDDIAHVLREGRVEYRGRQASDGLGAAMALATLGVDRGIDEFVRYSFVERNGLATFAVPVDRLLVRENPTINLLRPIREWTARFRGGNFSQSVIDLASAVDEALYQVTQSNKDQTAAALIDLLALLAQLERTAMYSTNARERVRLPPSGLWARDWRVALDDGSSAFAIAAGLASWREPDDGAGIIRQALRGDGWEGRRPPVGGYGRRPLDAVIADVLVRRAVDAHRGLDDATAGDAHADAWGGVVTAAWVSAGPLAELSVGEVQLKRIEHILSGLMLLNWRGSGLRRQDSPDVDAVEALDHAEVEHPVSDDDEEVLDAVVTRKPGVLWQVPAWVALLKLCFHHRSTARALGVSVVADSGLARSIAARRLDDAVSDAARRLRIAGLQPKMAPYHLRPDPAFPVATFLATPISDAALASLAARVTNFSAEASLSPDSAPVAVGYAVSDA